MALTIRRLKAQDIGPLFVMSKALHSERPIEYPEMDEEEQERKMMWVMGQIANEACIFLIAYDGKKPVGYFLGHIHEHPYGKPKLTGVAMELFVVKEKRGRDIAFRLIREAVTMAVGLGVESFESTGIVGQTDKMWEKLGFKPYILYGYMPQATMAGVLAKGARIVGAKDESND